MLNHDCARSPFHASLGIATSRLLIHLRKFAWGNLEVETRSHSLSTFEVGSSEHSPWRHSSTKFSQFAPDICDLGDGDEAKVGRKSHSPNLYLGLRLERARGWIMCSGGLNCFSGAWTTRSNAISHASYVWNLRNLREFQNPWFLSNETSCTNSAPFRLLKRTISFGIAINNRQTKYLVLWWWCRNPTNACTTVLINMSFYLNTKGWSKAQVATRA